MSPNKDNNFQTNLHIAFYPWFGLGHLTSFLRLANKLAEKGHKISYIIPTKTQPKLATQNHHPNNLTFVPITVPPVDGLPTGAETTNDVPASAGLLLLTALDLTKDTIESLLVSLKPDIILYDFAYWVPQLAHKHGIKAMHYITAYISTVAYVAIGPGLDPPANIVVDPPPGFPSTVVRMHPHESRMVHGVLTSGAGLEGLSLVERWNKSFSDCDAIGVKSCKEMERNYCDYIEKVYGKPVFLAGPMVPQTPTSKLEERFDNWLNGFGVGSVIYCALGSECVLGINQFHEVLLGLELTGRPFLAALKPPIGYETVEAAFPEGFADRIRGKGLVEGGWVQQQQILKHPSVGCFITHCGAGSLSEALASECQVVLMPQASDQFLNARLMTLEMKIGVEVKQRENSEDGCITFPREEIQKAVKMVMEEDSEIGKEVKENHGKWREFITKEGLEDSYINGFIQSIQHLVAG